MQVRQRIVWFCIYLAVIAVFLPGASIGQAAEGQGRAMEQENSSDQEHSSISKLDEMVVTGTKTPHKLKDVPVQTIVITSEEIEKTNAKNALGVLKEIPGISIANHDDVFGTYTWRAAMQGLSFNDGYGLILIDGQRAMGCGQSGGMGEYGIGLNQIPVGMIERIEVVKGPGSALYGSDAVTGVINVITKKIPRQATGWAGVSYGVYEVKREDADGDIEKADSDRKMSQFNAGYGDRINDRMGYLLVYSHDQSGDITEEPLTSDRHSMMGKLDARLGDNVDFFSKLEVSDYQKTGNREEDSYRIALGADWQLNPNHLLSFKGYTYLWDFAHGAPGDQYGYKYGDIGFNQGELQYIWNAGDSNILTAGYEYQAQNIDYFIENQDGSLITVDEDVTTSSAFLQDELGIGNHFTLIGGVRYDDHSVFGEEVNPKFSAMIRFLEATTFRASVGRSFKSPTIRQLYYDIPYRHGSFYAQSNRDLKPEKGVGYTAGVEQRLLNDRMMISLGYFRNDIEDLVVRVDTGDIYNGLPLVRYENVENGWTQGFEFMITAQINSAFDINLSYTYTETENEASDKALTYVPDHLASLRFNYEWERLDAGISALLSHTGSQYTDSDNTSEIDAHTVLDAKIFKRLSSRAKLSFEANDIFDTRKNAEDSYYAGQSFAVKMDLEF